MDKGLEFLLRRISPEYLKELLAGEMEAQQPCYYMNKFGSFLGKGKYTEVVLDGLSDIIFYVYTKDNPATDGNEEIEIIKDTVQKIFLKTIKKYYDDAYCSEEENDD
jgi:hypothetical protein